MIYYFYLPKKAINEATIFYVNIIKEALEFENDQVIIKDSLNFDFKKEDYILTIRLRDYLASYLKYKTQNTIYWFQGIQPEEYLMLNNYSIKAKLVKLVLDQLEKWVAKNVKYPFFVSKKMQNHFENKHHLKFKNSIIMPCFNKYLNQEMYFNLKKEASFVYAGSLFAWQCFDKTIKLFKEIECQIPAATLTILTNEVDRAKAELKALGITNFDVKFVPLKQLDEELAKYKYGFIVRDNILINNVSTPTKLSSYLSVGLIPIYTDVIDDFNCKLKQYSYQIVLDHTQNLQQWANQIKLFSEKKITLTDQFVATKALFDDYYNQKEYIKVINEIIKK